MTVVQPPAAIDLNRVLESDVPCRKCGYNLRGLAESGRCPECGTPVGISVCGDMLRFSHPDWLDTLRSGVNLILLGILILILGTVLGVVVGIVLQAKLHMRVLSPIILIPALLYGTMALLGSWRLTTPDPSGIGEDQYGTSRKLIRYGLFVGIWNYGLSLALLLATLPPVAVKIIESVSFIVQLFGVVAVFAQLHYFNKLAARIPDNQLAGRAMFLMYAMGFTQFVYVGIHSLQQLTGPIKSVSPIRMIASVCMLVFGVMYLSMLTKFGQRFKEAATLARPLWQVTENS